MEHEAAVQQAEVVQEGSENGDGFEDVEGGDGVNGEVFEEAEDDDDGHEVAAEEDVDDEYVFHEAEDGTNGHHDDQDVFHEAEDVADGFGPDDDDVFHEAEEVADPDDDVFDDAEHGADPNEAEEVADDDVFDDAEHGADPNEAGDGVEDDPEEEEEDDEFEEVDDYNTILEHLSREWMQSELDHKISKVASNHMWMLAKTWFHRLYRAKELQNITKKTPSFLHIRRKMQEKNVPKIHMQFAYEDKETGDLSIVEDVEVTPKSQFPPNQYRKVWETAHVEVIFQNHFQFPTFQSTTISTCFCFEKYV